MKWLLVKKDGEAHLRTLSKICDGAILSNLPAVNCICKECPSQIFDRILNALEIKGHHVHENKKKSDCSTTIIIFVLFKKLTVRLTLASFLKSQVNTKEFEIMPCDVMVMWNSKIIFLKWKLRAEMFFS